jgi:hypothetical protein
MIRSTKKYDSESFEENDHINKKLPSFYTISDDTITTQLPKGQLEDSDENTSDTERVTHDLSQVKINDETKEFLPEINENNCIKYEIEEIEKFGNHQFKVDKLCTWQECNIETIKSLIEGDSMEPEDKFEQILSRLKQTDILSAEEIEKRYPKFDPRFYEFLEQASRDKYKVLSELEKVDPVISTEEGDYNIKFD